MSSCCTPDGFCSGRSIERSPESLQGNLCKPSSLPPLYPLPDLPVTARRGWGWGRGTAGGAGQLCPARPRPRGGPAWSYPALPRRGSAPPAMMPVIYSAAQHGLSRGLGVPFQRRPRVLEAAAVAPRGLRQPRRSRTLARTLEPPEHMQQGDEALFLWPPADPIPGSPLS